MDHREVVLRVQPDLIDRHGPFGVVWMHVHDFTDNAVGRGEEAERASTVDIVGENRLQSRRAAWPDSNRATRLIHAQQGDPYSSRRRRIHCPTGDFPRIDAVAKDQLMMDEGPDEIDREQHADENFSRPRAQLNLKSGNSNLEATDKICTAAKAGHRAIAFFPW